MDEILFLKEFFETPRKGFHIRELSRILNKNHMTTRKYLNLLVKQQYLKKEKSHLYDVFTPNISKKFLNLKLFYNLEKIRTSNLLNKINEVYDYPQIILFGSFAEAKDDETGDIDICLITNIKKNFKTEEFENSLKRKIDIRIYSETEWKKLIKTNPELVNNILKGLVLSDEFEVIM